MKIKAFFAFLRYQKRPKKVAGGEQPLVDIDTLPKVVGMNHRDTPAQKTAKVVSMFQ